MAITFPWTPAPQTKAKPLSPSFIPALGGTKGTGSYVAPQTSILSSSTSRNTTSNTGSTSGSGGGSSTPKVSVASQPVDTGPSADDIRNQIGNNYNSAIDLINQRAAALPGYQAQDTGYVMDQYGNMVKSLGQGQESALSKLGIAGQNVQTNKANSIADLGSNLRQMMNATQMQLGAMGAGDSSASQVMAPYAFSKVAAKEGAGIQKQANQQFADIESKKVDLQSTYNTQLTGIEQWKGDQLNQLTQYYRGLQSQIEDAKANASAERASQLQQLEVGLFNTATQKAQSIEAEARNYQATLSQWATQRVAELENAKIAMSQNSNFDPTAIAYNDLGGVNYGGDGGTDFQSLISGNRKKIYGV